MEAATRYLPPVPGHLATVLANNQAVLWNQVIPVSAPSVLTMSDIAIRTRVPASFAPVLRAAVATFSSYGFVLSVIHSYGKTFLCVAFKKQGGDTSVVLCNSLAVDNHECKGVVCPDWSWFLSNTNRVPNVEGWQQAGELLPFFLEYVVRTYDPIIGEKLNEY